MRPRVWRIATGDGPVTQTFTITPEQRDAFKRAGILRLDGLLSAEGVRRAREAVLRPLERLGLWKAGAWHLDALPRPQWPNTGLKTSEVIGNRHPELAALVENRRSRRLSMRCWRGAHTSGPDPTGVHRCSSHCRMHKDGPFHPAGILTVRGWRAAKAPACSCLPSSMWSTRVAAAPWPSLVRTTC